MEYYRYIIKLLRCISLASILCFLIVFAEAQIVVPVSEFGSNVFEVSDAGGYCEVDFKTYGKSNGELMKVLKDFVNYELEESEITWILVLNLVLDDYNVEGDYYSGTLVFGVRPNPTYEARQILLDNGSEDGALIIQSKKVDPVTLFNVTSDCEPFSAFPGRKTQVTLSGSQVGVSYYIDNDTIQGTGFPITFEKVFTEGVYYVRAKKKGYGERTMNGNINISYFPFLKAGLCTKQNDLEGILPPIGPIRPGCGFYVEKVSFIDLMSKDQKRQLDKMIQEINMGKSTCCPGFKIRRVNNAIHLMSGPNIKGVEWESEVFLSLDNGTGGKQYRIWALMEPTVYPIERYQLLKGDMYGDRYSLKLDGAQLSVVYRLFRDSVFVTERIGTLEPVEFEDLSGGGTYHVEAHYWDTIIPMNGSLYVDKNVGGANYVKESVYVNEENPVSTYVYYDGLGREIQLRQEDNSVGGYDIIQSIVYDSTGRVSKSYLPFSVRENQGYRKFALSEQDEYYTNKFGVNHYAYSETKYNNRPEDQIVEQSFYGEKLKMGSGHTVKTNVRQYTTGDNVKKYVLDGSSVKLEGNYSYRELIVKQVTDAENVKYTEYYDFQGNLICKSQDEVKTYYVYDDLNRQRYIISPLQDAEFTSGTKTLEQLSKLCYYTEYNELNKPYKLYVPGAGCTIYLYDKRGRAVLVQDARMRAEGKWLFTKYDEMDRPVITGTCSGTESAHKTGLAGQFVFGEARGTVLHGYTNNTYPVVADENACLTITYYDDYAWAGASDMSYSPSESLGAEKSERVKGLVTGVKNKVLGITGNTWLKTVTYFDKKYNAIQTVKQLYPSGVEITSNLHNFSGDVTRIKVKQTIGSVVNEYNRYLEYDNLGRLTRVKQQVTGDNANGLVTLSSYEYDDLGRVSRKMLHNDVDTTTYTYDIVGRQVAARSRNFSYEVGFEHVETGLSGKVTPRYNGNVSHIKWGNGSNVTDLYSYNYDSSSQLTGAYLYKKSGTTWNAHSSFAEKDITYDLNGNLTSLTRTSSSGVASSLSYTYDGNQVSKINNGPSYAYDAVGNMTVDGLRGASISYNILNLPEEVCLGNEKVSYIYTSAGEKLATRVGSSLTYYRGPLVYSGNNLLYLVHPEGLTRKSTIGFVYYYAKRDHLGSTRVLCHASGNTLVADQTTGYYPFGLAHGHGNLNLNRYLFSGKELQDQSLGGKLLGLYDFGSRFYDPTLGRWFNVDPKLEFVSPYGYCANNPVLYIDPNGEDIVLTISKEVTVTVATRLIDLKITVPDWTGARKIFTKSIRLQGDEILLAALDIVGIVDPTGIADALSASLYAQQGDLVNAMVSGVGLIPYLGDFAKMFRMKNHFKILSMAVESGAGAAKGGGRGLGNPFVGKSFEEIDHMFRMKGFEMKGIDPLMGKGSYFNPKTGTKYYLDWGEKEYKTGRESFHVDVFYNGHLKYEKAKFFLDGSPKQYKELKTKR